MDVYLLRHAKAVAYTPTDHERVLADKGVRQARACGEWIRKEKLTFDRVIVSDAQRTLETWQSLECSGEVIVTPDAYNASSSQLEQLIRQCHGAHSILVIAHNPGISELAGQAGFDRDLRTCELVHLSASEEAADFCAELASVVSSFRPEID